MSEMLRAAVLVTGPLTLATLLQQAGELNGRSSVCTEVRGQGESGSVSFLLDLMEEVYLLFGELPLTCS